MGQADKYIDRAMFAPETTARFWSKVQIDDGCWRWTGSTIRGYGQFTFRRPGKQSHLYAHRVAWVLTHGPIADGLKVCHACDTPICVRPDHLFLGTQADNLNDARAKGRLRDGQHLRKLSDEEVAYIRVAYTRGNGLALAARFGVSNATVSRVARSLNKFQQFPEARRGVA